jgi:hypothetical protein
MTSLISALMSCYIYRSMFGIPPIGISGLGIKFVIGFSLLPKPPTSINAFIL